MIDDEWPVWRTTRAARIGGTVVVVLAALSAIALTTNPPPSTGYLPAIVLWLVTAAYGVGCWQYAFVTRVTCTPQGLVIRNPLKEVVVPWDDIQQVEPTYWGLLVRRVEGGAIFARAVQKADISTHLGRKTRADEVAKRIELIAASGVRPSSGG